MSHCYFFKRIEMLLKSAQQIIMHLTPIFVVHQLASFWMVNS